MFTCFTGIDGCGKSSQIAHLKKYWEERGLQVKVTKAYGQKEKRAVGHLLKTWSDMAITLAFQAFYAEQRSQVELGLAKGQVVIADRWDEAFLSYHEQFGELATDHETRKALHRLAFAGLKPETTVLLDLEVGKARQRIEKRGQLSFFDRKDAVYHEALRQYYLKKAQAESWIVIDASQSKKRIFQQILTAF